MYAPGGRDRTENRVNLSLLAGTITNPADGTISGVAPQAQLVVMKVFGDNSTGAAEDDILAALEDCVKLGVDAVNLSLGSPAGSTSRPDMLSTMNVYSNLEKAGIVVAAAAGNEYTAAYKNLWENDNCKALEQVYFLGNPPENVSTRMFVSKVADMTVYYDAALAAQWAPEGETT